MVDFDPMASNDYDDLQELIRNHFRHTGSKRALAMLNDWEKTKKDFVKVMPRDYKRVLEKKGEGVRLVAA